MSRRTNYAEGRVPPAPNRKPTHRKMSTKTNRVETLPYHMTGLQTILAASIVLQNLGEAEETGRLVFSGDLGSCCVRLAKGRVRRVDSPNGDKGLAALSSLVLSTKGTWGFRQTDGEPQGPDNYHVTDALMQVATALDHTSTLRKVA